MSRDYSHAALPPETQILGLRLRPLSLGHIILMKRHDCAFVADDERNATIEDLLMGALICSMTWEQWESFCESATFESEIAQWGKKASRAVKSETNFNLLARFGMFKAYVDEGSKMPVFWDETEGGGKGSGAPWYQCVKLVLTGELGYSMTEALNSPLQQCIMDYFRHAESTGAITLATEQQVQQMEALA